jgi:hypothetical protein
LFAFKCLAVFNAAQHLHAVRAELRPRRMLATPSFSMSGD